MDKLPEHNALKETYKLLCHLTDPKKTPRLPKYIRDKAKDCLKHYPVKSRLEELYDMVDFFEPR